MNKCIGTFIGIAAILAGNVSAADATSSPAAPLAAPCVVDVTDWPLGILPDDASAAFGPATLAACKQAVVDWPVGVLPDDSFPGTYPYASPHHSPSAVSSAVGGAGAFIPPSHANGVFGAGGPLAGIGGAGAFIPGPAPTTDPDHD